MPNKVLGSFVKKLQRKKVRNKKHRLAVFASGAGSNAKKIIEYFGKSNAVEVALIVCNKPDAGVLVIAEISNIPYILIDKERFFRGDHYLDELKKEEIRSLETTLPLAGSYKSEYRFAV